MSPSRGVRWSALLTIAVLTTLPASPARSQSVFDDPSPFLEGPVDPLARSPRLLGMGRLSFVLDDAHNRINLWDLGKNPIGVIFADSTSTAELGPTTGATSTSTERFGVVPTFERQTGASRDTRMFYEGWRRTGTSTYGAVGDWSAHRSDIPYGEDVEQRSELSRPNIMPILAGRIPFVRSNRVTGAIRMLIASPRYDKSYRLFVRNAAGEFLDHDGAEVGPPDFFVPEETHVRSTGIGAHLGFHPSRALQVAVGYDIVNHQSKGENVGYRNSSEVGEERLYRVGQATVTGAFGRGLEWGVDGQGWRSKSDQTWVFTTSAGTASVPLNGRGKLLDRKEEGSKLRGRLRWFSDRFEIGAGVSTSYRQVQITPPALDDLSSLNHFLNVVWLTNGADTLAIPDSVVHNTIEDRSWEVGGGLAWKRTGTILGVEGHFFQALRGQALSGAGPKQVGWDVRAGMERRLLDPISLRAGYVYRWEDRDDYTVQNEFKTHSATVGLGFHPDGVRWSFDAGYAFEWTLADYEDPADPRTSRHDLATRLRWQF